MNLIPALVADLLQGHRRRQTVINGNEESETSKKVSEAEGTVVAKDTATLSAVLSGRVSFDVEEMRRRDEHDAAQGR